MSDTPDPSASADRLRLGLDQAVDRLCGRVRTLEFQLATVAGADPPEAPLDEPAFSALAGPAGWIAGVVPFLGEVERRLAALGERCARLQVDHTQAVAALTAEIGAAQAELTALRGESARRQEQHAREVQRQREDAAAASARLRQAREGLQREAELRRAGIAEVRSIAVEVERVAAADPEAVSVEHLAQPLAALREAIAAGSAEGMGATAEEVLVGWARVVNARAASAAQELSAVRWQLSEREHQREQGERERQERRALEAALADLRQERDRAQTELRTARAACDEARRQAETAAQELVAARRQWAAQRAGYDDLLREARQAVVAAREALRRTQSDHRQITETLQAEVVQWRRRSTER